jgi:hypothetical protein
LGHQVIAIPDADTRPRKNLLLGRAISREARMPVEVILTEIEDRRGMRRKRWREFQLKAR